MMRRSPAVSTLLSRIAPVPIVLVPIALAAMALLTRRRWLEYGMFGVAAAGLAAGAAAALHL